MTPRTAVRLFCFPHAGGTPNVFSPWINLAPSWLEIMAVQYRGRGRRWREPPHKRMSCLIDELVHTVTSDASKPFAFFGHSMGAAVAFELACRLSQTSSVSPMRLFLAGRGAPQAQYKDANIHQMSDNDLRETIKKFSGTPTELLTEEGYFDLFMPTIRADFEVLETWIYHQCQIDIPISLFAGIKDTVAPIESFSQWRRCTTGDVETVTLDDGHFFVQTQKERILSHVAERLITRALS